MADDADSSSLESDVDIQDHKYDAEEETESKDAARLASRALKVKTPKGKTRPVDTAKSPQGACAISSSCSDCDVGERNIETSDGDDENEPVVKKRRSSASSSASMTRRPNVVIPNQQGRRRIRREFPPTDDNNRSNELVTSTAGPISKGAHRVYPTPLRTPADAAVLMCNFCWADKGQVVPYAKLESLKAHWRNDKVHLGLFDTFAVKKGTVVTVYTCNAASNGSCACGAAFDHLQKWDRHVAVKKYTCRNSCGAVFVCTDDEGSHAKKHCSTIAAEFACTVAGCGHVAPTPGALYEHMRGPVHLARERNLACNVPGCSFQHYYQSKMAQHADNVHLATRVFTCSEEGCGHQFKTAGDLKKHAGTHIATYEIACAQTTAGGEPCTKLFQTHRGRKAHERDCHGEPRFACMLCPMAFTVKVHCDEHALTHSDARTYSCERCGQTFRQKSVKANHVLYVHDKSRPHVCQCQGGQQPAQRK
jgi:hypothetical protein